LSVDRFFSTIPIARRNVQRIVAITNNELPVLGSAHELFALSINASSLGFFFTF